ncbi:MAG: hypothetical protein GY746_04085 [Gammaproteobacteria bacterium]|nr:hypothetical protein [Gammaproteobacteria bacterium]MCP4831963.1 hypothetical protein [Gammaproteobacteria bacterium]MCP4927565.1 hypothetical protein [Gammaproteobacteria bacterium]
MIGESILLLAIILFWYLSDIPVSYLTGWNAVVNSYRFNGVVAGEKYRLRSGFGHTNLTYTVNQEGFFINKNLPLTLDLRKVYIPFSEIKELHDDAILFSGCSVWFKKTTRKYIIPPVIADHIFRARPDLRGT